MKISFAKHNCRLYGVESKVFFANEDFLELSLAKLQRILYKNEDPNEKIREKLIDYVFLAPPWGGMDYSTDDNYSIYRSIHPDIKRIMDKVLDFSEKIVLCLPRNINVEEIVGLLVESFEEKGRVCERAAIEVEKIYLNNKFKMNLVYFGNASKVVLLRNSKFKKK